MNFKLRLVSVLVLTSFFFSSCASTTTIRSSDPDAKIFIDGEFLGRGSISHTDSKIVGSTTHVRIEKPGCEPMSYMFSRNEELNVGACIGGVFVLFPLLWIMNYKPEHHYEYSCEKRKTGSLDFLHNLDPSLRTSMAH